MGKSQSAIGQSVQIRQAVKVALAAASNLDDTLLDIRLAMRGSATYLHGMLLECEISMLNTMSNIEELQGELDA